MRLSGKILFTICIFLPALQSRAQTTSGLDFLNVAPDTRSLSLAEAVTSVPTGASAIYTNPANLGFELSTGVSASYTLWIADVYNSHVAVNLKRGNDTFAFGLLNSTASDFEARMRPGPPDGSFSVSYLSAAAAYARTFNNISVGAAGHFIREEYLVNNASGYALNFGISGHWLNRRLRAGATLLNLGEMNELIDEATELPANVRAGISGKIFEFIPSKNEDLPILVILYFDYVKPLEKDIRSNFISHNPNEGFFNLGISFDVAETIILRAGYKTGETERPISFGVGIEMENLNFNYAMIPFNTGFGTVHSIGLQYYF